MDDAWIAPQAAKTTLLYACWIRVEDNVEGVDAVCGVDGRRYVVIVRRDGTSAPTIIGDDVVVVVVSWTLVWLDEVTQQSASVGSDTSSVCLLRRRVRYSVRGRVFVGELP